MDNDMQDLKLFTQICWFLGNLVYTSDQVASEVLGETVMVECCLLLLQNNQVLDPQLLEKLYWALVKFIQPDLPVAQVEALWTIVSVGLQVQHLATLQNVLINLRQLCDHYVDFVLERIAPEQVALVVANMVHPDLHEECIDIVGQLSITDNQDKIDTLLQAGYMAHASLMMKQLQGKPLHSLVWGLSNLAVNDKQAVALFSEPGLYEQVMALTQEKDPILRSEASLVIANALNTCEEATRQMFWT